MHCVIDLFTLALSCPPRALTELQVIGIPLLIGLAVAWGALHIFAISDRHANPRVYLAIRLALLIVSLAAVMGGMAWTEARIAG